MTVTIIAEAGSGPAPAWEFARWCDAAQQAGATAIKMQMFRAESFPAPEQASKRPLEFPRERLEEFCYSAHMRGLLAGVSVFDTDAAEHAARTCDFVKLAAREASNFPLIMATANAAILFGRPLYRSITTLDELYRLDGIIHFWTVPQYPASLVLSCLRLLQAARYFRYHNMPFGWSSHTRGTGLDCVLASRLGATVIEKHIDLDGHGIEHGHSLTPVRFRLMADAIRSYERT